MPLRRASSCMIGHLWQLALANLRWGAEPHLWGSAPGQVPEVANVVESRLLATQPKQALVFFVDDTHEMGVHCRWN